MVIFLCEWINAEIVSIIIKAGLVYPDKHQIEIIRRYPHLWKPLETYHLRPNCYVTPLNLIAEVLKTPIHNRVIDLISETNVNESLPATNKFNINTGDVRLEGETSKSQSKGYPHPLLGCAIRVQNRHLLFFEDEHIHISLSITLGSLPIANAKD